MEQPSDEQPLDLFEYTPFHDASSEIRLFELEDSSPVPPNEDEMVQGTLVHVPLESAPTYIALSYAWGDPTDTVEILLAGRRKSVTRSVFTFLHQALRFLQGGRFQTRHFWIDALCINQSDDAEKSHQVQRMGTIYSVADHVIIWLGLSGQRSDRAIQFFRDLWTAYPDIVSDSTARDRFHSGRKPWNSLFIKFRRFKARRSRRGVEWMFQTMRDNYSDTLEPLLSLANRPWWCRVWVQQEVGLARNAYMACGEELIAWRDVVHAKAILTHLFQYAILEQWTLPYPFQLDLRGLDTFTLHQINARMQGTCRTSDYQIYNDPRFQYSILDLLAVNASNPKTRMLASLPVDYVYSVLGISSDAAMFERFVRPDYSKPIEEVFIELAKYLLQAHGPVTFGFCGLEFPDVLQLPSWVPDFSSPMRTIYLGKVPDLIATTSRSCYTASGHDCSFEYEVSELELRLKGTVVDSITHVGEALKDMREVELEEFPLQDWMIAYHKFRTSLAHFDVAALEDAWWRVPIADQDWRADTPVRAQASMKSGYEELKNYLGAGLDGTFLSPAAAHFSQVLVRTAMNRMPFLSKGGLLGLGPSTAELGDKIVIISGCDTPLILRQTEENGHFRIVGDAYVYGIMDGEFMQRNPEFETMVII